MSANLTGNSKLVVISQPYASIGDREQCYSLPRPHSNEVIVQIGQRFRRSVELVCNESLHLVAIATGGSSIVYSIAAWLAIRQPEVKVVVSTINPSKPVNNIDLNFVPGRNTCRTIIIDNSIKTGETISWGLELLAAKGCPANEVVKLIHYRDKLESEVAQDLKERFGVDVISLFELDELEVIGV